MMSTKMRVSPPPRRRKPALVFLPGTALMLMLLTSCSLVDILLGNGPAAPELGIASTLGIADGSDILPGVQVTVDASASSDPNGDPFGISWSLTVPAGSASVLDEGFASGAVTQFTPDIEGEYTLTASLSDGRLSRQVEIPLKTPETALEARWLLNGGLNDTSLYGRTLLPAGAQTFTTDRNGTADSAYQLSATTSLSYAPTALETGIFQLSAVATNGDFSIVLWLRLDVTPAADFTLVTMDNNVAGDTAGWRIGYNDVNDELVLLFDFGTETESVSIPGVDMAFAAGEWHHIALSYDQSENSAVIYYDGLDQEVETPAAVPAHPNSATLSLGAHAPRGLPGFEGAVDDIRIYNRLLSAEEIAAIIDIP